MNVSSLFNILIIFLFSVVALGCNKNTKSNNYTFLKLQEANVIFNNTTAGDISIELYSENSIVQPRGSKHIVVLGAPRYLLIKDGNIVCGRCPTPSDDGIRALIE